MAAPTIRDFHLSLWAVAPTQLHGFHSVHIVPYLRGIDAPHLVFKATCEVAQDGLFEIFASLLVERRGQNACFEGALGALRSLELTRVRPSLVVSAQVYSWVRLRTVLHTTSKVRGSSPTPVQ